LRLRGAAEPLSAEAGVGPPIMQEIPHVLSQVIASAKAYPSTLQDKND